MQYNTVLNKRAIVSLIITRALTAIKAHAETNELIKKAKGTNSVGSDIITIRWLKKLVKNIAPHLCHLINTIHNTQIYPKILKTSRITPNLKPENNPEIINSYRPLNNLSCIEKLVQQHIKSSLISFLDMNEIILPDHHGSCRYDSTTTALACLNHKLKVNYSNNNISASIQTN